MAFVARDGVSIQKAIINLYKAGFHKIIKIFFCVIIPGAQPNLFLHKYIKCKNIINNIITNNVNSVIEP